MRVVVIGNGAAGMEAALAVRAREPGASITIVSEESDHFVSRTALMYVLAGQLSHRCIEPHERDHYERHRFERVRARAVGVDAPGKRVRLADGEALAYDRLVIACGSRPRPAPWPGAELAGVGSFVTLQDLEWLERELFGGPGHGGRPPRPDAHGAHEGSPYAARQSAREQRGSPPQNPVVIGGGLIGIEVVEVMLAAGLRPRFFVREESFWPMALDPREARWICDRLREHGADVRLGEEIVALDGVDVVRGVRTREGAFPCDLCVVAIGVVPNTEWLRGSAIELDAQGGIVVDASLRASAPDVFAAGDCASVPWRGGARGPELLWYTARDQGRVAGRAACGEDASYARRHVYNSAKLMDVEYTTVGAATPREGDRTFFHEERGRVRSTTRILVRDERVIGFTMLGRRWDHSVLLRWIDEGRELAFVLARLEEARFDTELVPPLRIAREALEA